MPNKRTYALVRKIQDQTCSQIAGALDLPELRVFTKFNRAGVDFSSQFHAPFRRIKYTVNTTKSIYYPKHGTEQKTRNSSSQFPCRTRNKPPHAKGGGCSFENPQIYIYQIPQISHFWSPLKSEFQQGFILQIIPFIYYYHIVNSNSDLILQH